LFPFTRTDGNTRCLFSLVISSELPALSFNAALHWCVGHDVAGFISAAVYQTHEEALSIRDRTFFSGTPKHGFTFHDMS